MTAETKTIWNGVDRRCSHTLQLAAYPLQCRKCMKFVPDVRYFLGGDRRNAMRGIRQMCNRVAGTTFVTPDGKWLIRVDYETESQENHHRDGFNPHHIEHYVRVVDRISSVSVEAI